MENTNDSKGASKALTIQHILVPTDFSPCASRALAYAVGLARHFGASIELLHVITPEDEDAYTSMVSAPPAVAREAELDEVLDGYLQNAIEQHDLHGVEITPHKAYALSPPAKIVSCAEKKDADLIVMGTNGRRGVRRFVMGSVTEEVLRRAPCDVFTVKHEGARRARPFQHMLVPIDCFEHSRDQLRRAKEIAARYGMDIDVLYVVEPQVIPDTISGLATIYDLIPDVKEKARRQMRQFMEEAEGPDVSWTPHVVEGHTATEVIRMARELKSDLIAVAMHRPDGMERLFMGSVAERIVRLAPCPTWLIRTDEHLPGLADEAVTNEAGEDRPA